MKILIDECAPKALKVSLAAHGHNCSTVQEAGWAGKSNGELLTLAESEFDAFITLDTNLRYQQNLAKRQMPIVVLISPSNRLTDLKRLFPACAEALKTIQPGDVVNVR